MNEIPLLSFSSDFDECINKTHQCNQTCINTQGGYNCSCYHGYQLSKNGRDCDDVDECALGPDKCGAHARCTNEPGSFVCMCEAGYSGDGRNCSGNEALVSIMKFTFQ